VVSRVLVDTNVIVSYLLERSAEQQRRAAELIEAAEDPDRRLLLHQLVLAESAFVLLRIYEQPAAQVSAMLAKLLAVPGSEPVAELGWPRVLELWPTTVPDFQDAVLISAAETLRPDSVATFDQSFNRKLRSLGVPTFW
jgi:predicted nucleic acid-binding protein